jgi:hypothetical protein
MNEEMYNPKEDPFNCRKCGNDPQVSRMTVVPKVLFAVSLFVLVASLLPTPSDKLTDGIRVRVAVAFIGSLFSASLFGVLWVLTSRCKACKSWLPRGMRS